MAEVFRAVDLAPPRAGRTVAVKRLLPRLAGDPEYVALFAAEAALSLRLDHPNIVRVFESGVADDQYFIAMEYVDGRDLGQVVRRCRERKILLPIDFAVFLVVTLLEALGYAHAATDGDGRALDIVHCDVSPSNLFVSRTGEVKLGDFGIARVKSRDGEDSEAKIWGKPYYLSPELLDGRVEPSADLWAAAATLYELLSNQRPFQGATPDEVQAAIRSARPAPVQSLRPDVPDALAEVVERGLCADKSQRFPDAAAFIEALRPHLNELIGNPMAIAAVVRGLFGA
jgi:serine/threonine-protein kinase